MSAAPRHVITIPYKGDDGVLKKMMQTYVDTLEQSVALNQNHPVELEEIRQRVLCILDQIKNHLFRNKHPELAKRPLWSEIHPLPENTSEPIDGWTVVHKKPVEVRS